MPTLTIGLVPMHNINNIMFRTRTYIANRRNMLNLNKYKLIVKTNLTLRVHTIIV